jgi:hypothetical protein
MSQDELLEVQKRAPVRDLLSQLDNCLPCILALGALTYAALINIPAAMSVGSDDRAARNELTLLARRSINTWTLMMTYSTTHCCSKTVPLYTSSWTVNFTFTPARQSTVS